MPIRNVKTTSKLKYNLLDYEQRPIHPFHSSEDCFPLSSDSNISRPQEVSKHTKA